MERPAEHAVNIAGGLHHAMHGSAAGFCVLNDVVLAIRTLLAAGAERVAYVDIDVHHGDGVQAAFYDDPRVLTVSLHQDPRTLYPGTGMASEVGSRRGGGQLGQPGAAAGHGRRRLAEGLQRGGTGCGRAFGPQVLVTQCGCDTHHEDPLADLALTVDGQRAAYAALHELAHRAADGRWLALGGGGYGVLRCVPRAWTHLLAEVTGRPIAPEVEIPQSWTTICAARGARQAAAADGRGPRPAPQPWMPGGESWLDRSIAATRDASFPLLGLDPDDLVTEPMRPADPGGSSLRASYPPHWEADVVVADGGTVHLRPIIPDDADALVHFHPRLSMRTRYLRYFSAYPTIPPRDLIRFSHVDHVDRVALAAGWAARSSRSDASTGCRTADRPGLAEVAFVVADAHQGRGIGSVLLEHLVEIGRELGIAGSRRVVLAENQKMMRVFLDAGFAPSRRLEGNEVSLEFDIAATDLTREGDGRTGAAGRFPLDRAAAASRAR